MRLIVLYEELADYFLVCIDRYSAVYGAEILLIRKESNSVAPFEFSETRNVSLIDRSRFSGNELQELVRKWNPDVIFCGGWAYDPYMKICREWRMKIPVILGLDNWWEGTLKQRIASMFGKFFFRKRFSGCFVPGSRQEKFALHLGFSRDHIRRGAYACNFGLFNHVFQRTFPQKKREFPHRFVFAGRYVSEKGVELLWKAFQRLRAETNTGWELWCAGTGNIPPSEVEGVSHFGFVQPPEMERLMKETSVFILPSRFEPWGVVVHEFAAAGFPLLLSDKVGAAEMFLKEGQNGFSFRADDEEEIYLVMKRVIQMNDTELMTMGEMSNELAKQITPETWSRSLYELILEKVN